MVTQLLTTREQHGEAIAHLTGHVQRIEENFSVQSQSGNGQYAVTKIDGEWICECPDNKYTPNASISTHSVPRFFGNLSAALEITRIFCG